MNRHCAHWREVHRLPPLNLFGELHNLEMASRRCSQEGRKHQSAAVESSRRLGQWSMPLERFHSAVDMSRGADISATVLTPAAVVPETEEKPSRAMVRTSTEQPQQRRLDLLRQRPEKATKLSPVQKCEEIAARIRAALQDQRQCAASSAAAANSDSTAPSTPGAFACACNGLIL